jgi:hypothetical protein
MCLNWSPLFSLIASKVRTFFGGFNSQVQTKFVFLEMKGTSEIYLTCNNVVEISSFDLHASEELIFDNVKVSKMMITFFYHLPV